ncbi:hypothetical protein ACFS3C_09705 [Azotobacter vinelandii]
MKALVLLESALPLGLGLLVGLLAGWAHFFPRWRRTCACSPRGGSPPPWPCNRCAWG